MVKIAKGVNKLIHYAVWQLLLYVYREFPLKIVSVYAPNLHWFRQFRLWHLFQPFGWFLGREIKVKQTRKTELSELSLHISQSFITYLYSSLFLAENIGISPSLSNDVRPRMRLHFSLVCNVGPHTLIPLFYCAVQHYICRSTHTAWKERSYAQSVSSETRSFCAATIKTYLDIHSLQRKI